MDEKKNQRLPHEHPVLERQKNLHRLKSRNLYEMTNILLFQFMR